MAGFMPAIHVFFAFAKDVDARDKPGHDGERVAIRPLTNSSLAHPAKI